MDLKTAIGIGNGIIVKKGIYYSNTGFYQTILKACSIMANHLSETQKQGPLDHENKANK